MNAALLKQSKYIKSEQFGGAEPTLTIARVDLEELEKDDKSTEVKGVVTFQEKSKRPPHAPLQWLLNVTNINALIAMFGMETDAWVGKRVTLYAQPMKDPFTGMPITGIRVRGSPDLDREVRFMMRKRGKKKPEEHVLRPTGTGKGAAPAPAPADPHEPSFDEIPPEPGAEG